MGVWLQSKSAVFAIRDGAGHEAPTLGVGPEHPTFFRNLDASRFLHDKDLAVVDRDEPGKNYRAPTFAEVKAARVAQRQARAAALSKKREREGAEAKRAVEVKRAEKKADAAARKKQAELDEIAERGTSEVI